MLFIQINWRFFLVYPCRYLASETSWPFAWYWIKYSISVKTNWMISLWQRAGGVHRSWYVECTETLVLWKQTYSCIPVFRSQHVHFSSNKFQFVMIKWDFLNKHHLWGLPARSCSIQLCLDSLTMVLSRKVQNIYRWSISCCNVFSFIQHIYYNIHEALEAC